MSCIFILILFLALGTSAMSHESLQQGKPKYGNNFFPQRHTQTGKRQQEEKGDWGAGGGEGGVWWVLLGLVKSFKEGHETHSE